MKLKTFFLTDTLNTQHVSKSFVNIPKYVDTIDSRVESQVLYFGARNFESEISIFKCIGSGFLYKYKVFRFIKACAYLLNEKDIDILMLIHISNYNAVLAKIFKYKNKLGKIYLKLDVDQKFFDYTPSKISRTLIDKLLTLSTVISYESKVVEESIRNSDIFSNSLNKLIYIPNCCPEASRVHKYNEKKQNIILTVGRLGSYQKNTELLLDVIDEMDLGTWNIWLVGSITKDIECKIENNKNKQNIFYKGNIIERNEILEIYNLSKVFVLPSRYEGFATVLCEASLFGNFIISTDVNGAQDITNNFEYGKCFSNKQELKSILNDLINGAIDINSLSKAQSEFTGQYFNWNSVIKKSGLIECFYD